MEIRKQYEEILRQQRWFRYAKAAGMFLPEYEEDLFYTDEQEEFFLEYEVQMGLDGLIRLFCPTASSPPR